MKTTVLTIGLLLNLLISFAQSSKLTLLEARTKTHLYYVELNGSDGKAYEMGRYLDKAGIGYSIRRTDTLRRKSDGSYEGERSKVILANNRLNLIVRTKRTETFALNTAVDVSAINTNLNNAYYLDNFFSACKELNKSYPLYHSNFRSGFSSWEKLDNKDRDPIQFRIYANYLLKKIKDSISAIQDRYVLLTNWLLQNLGTTDYATVKDSLTRLPADYRYSSWYFGTVVNEISKQRPEFFFRLAEDFPDKKEIIFSAAEDTKQVMQGLKTVNNHSAIKKEFFKERRFDKTMPYKTIGLYAIIAGLITYLIVQ